MENSEEMQAEDMAESGRGTDTVMAHMSLGEVVIPRSFLDDPEIMQSVKSIFEANGANMAEFTVGDAANKINPETGQPEFFFKSLKRIANVVLPNLGAAGGFANGLIQGQGLGGALKQGLGSGLQAAATIYGGPLAGAAAGGLNASLTGRDPLTGAITGGISGALNSSISSGLGDTALGRGVSDAFQGSKLQDIYTGASGALDRVGSGVSDLYSGSALQSAFKSGGDALKSIGIDTSSAASTKPTAVCGCASSYGPQLENAANMPGYKTNFIGPQPLNAANNLISKTVPSAINSTGVSSVANSNYIAPLLSAALGTSANDKAAKKLLEAQRANQELLAPYTQGFEFTPGDLTADPGYQFNLTEGTKAADRAQLARGGYFSGDAAKELAANTQGLADSTYNSAFNRALQSRQAGLTGALAGTGVNTDIGNIKANSATNTGNLYSGALGALLGGNTFTNTGALQGGNDIQALLRRLQLGNSAYAS
jgi:hypothetical protein